MEFIELVNDPETVVKMSAMATEIVREHYDPIIGKAQNDYMLERFQSPEAIAAQVEDGAKYYFAREGGKDVGFLSYYLHDDCLYLSKFYLYKDERGKGHSREMLSFLMSKAREAGMPSIELNVNRNNSAIKAYEALGFKRLREEKNDIGGGFVMDDYVYGIDVDS